VKKEKGGKHHIPENVHQPKKDRMGNGWGEERGRVMTRGKCKRRDGQGWGKKKTKKSAEEATMDHPAKSPPFQRLKTKKNGAEEKKGKMGAHEDTCGSRRGLISRPEGEVLTSSLRQKWVTSHRGGGKGRKRKSQVPPRRCYWKKGGGERKQQKKKRPSGSRPRGTSGHEIKKSDNRQVQSKHVTRNT